MPIIGSFGAGSGKGFGFGGGAPDFIMCNRWNYQRNVVIIEFILLHLMELLTVSNKEKDSTKL
jgi:hypothetical protein